MKLLLSSLLIIVLFGSCVSLKPYERQYVNDPEMGMGNDAGKGFSNHVYSIREGASPAGNTEGSGGCGCN